jgi:hypothetical protein
VFDVETQIAVKEQAGRDKDLPGLLLLRHVLEESRKKSRLWLVPPIPPPRQPPGGFTIFSSSV